MAEEVVTKDDINAEDNATHNKLNGVQTKEEHTDNDFVDSKESDDHPVAESKNDLSKDEDIADSPLVLHFEGSSRGSASPYSENKTLLDTSDKNRSANGQILDDEAVQDENNDENVVKNGSLKRSASFLFENDDLVAFDRSSSTDRAIERLFLAIERLEKEIDDPDTFKMHLPSKRPRNASPAHSATTDTISSRPSSGMSVRSENDLTNSGCEVPLSSGPRLSIGRKSGVDLSNPLYRLPLEYGWRRELVFRANVDSTMRRQADVYYYSPTGKKLRSTREVAEHIVHPELTVENFTFFKEPLGIEDPTKEIIREAKIIKNRTDSPQPGAEKSEDGVNAVEGKRTPKPKFPKGVQQDQILTGKAKSFKIKSKGSRLSTDSPIVTGKANVAETGNLSPKTRTPSDGSKLNKSIYEADESHEFPQSPLNFVPDEPVIDSPEKAFFGQQQPIIDHAMISVPKNFTSLLSDTIDVSLTTSLKKYVAPLANPIANSIANSIINHLPLGNQINNQISNNTIINQPSNQLPPQLGSQITTTVSNPIPASNPVGNQTPNQMTGRDMCPMRCPLANIELPTLQCSLCLCFYHNQCTGYIPNYNTSFVCKNCHLANSNMPPSTSPSQTSIRPAQKSPSVTISGSVTVQRFPKPSPIITKAPPQPRLVPVVSTRPKVFNQAAAKLNKSDNSLFKTVQKYPKQIANVEIKLNKNASWPGEKVPPPPQNKPNEVDPSLFPQSIAILNGHKFIVVPKPNPASTSPVSGVGANPKHADNAPKIMDAPFNLTSNTTITPIRHFSKSTEDAKDEIKIQPKTVLQSKSDSLFNLPNVISFDNLSAEYGKLLFKGDVAGFPFEAQGVKRSLSADVVDESNKRKTRGPPVPKLIPKVAKKAENGTPGTKGGGRGSKATDTKNKNYFAEFYKVNQERKYNSLVQIFQYLKMRELAAAARVCRMWREIADTPALWKSVRMKNSQVNDWEGLAGALKRHGTRHLDLRKMLLPPEVPEKVWEQFTEHIPTVDSLLRIDLCRCPASVVERVCSRMPQLQVLTATCVRCPQLNPAPLGTLTNLQELRIKGMTNLTLTSDLKCLENLTKLKHLSITSVKDLGQCGCVAVGSLTSLESLELGECTGEVGGAGLLRRLMSLTRLRLEKCPGAAGGSTLIRTASSLPLLRQLELINFDIRPGFEDALGKCTNIKRLLIIPTYVSQSATTNRCVLAGVLRLRSSLTHLVWGVTIELLRVTELFIDQCGRDPAQQAAAGAPPSAGDLKQPQILPAAPKPRKSVNDSIPVLKPVPSLPVDEAGSPAIAGRPQVEILPLPSLQRLLAAELPDTRLKLLRIPFHATWRQTFNDFD